MVTRDKKHFKFLLLLTMIYILAIVTPAVVAYKLVEIGPILTNAGTYVFPISYLCGDLLTEVYGYDVARTLIWSALPCSLCYGLLVVGLIHLPSPSFWHFQADYQEVLGRAFRLLLGGSVGILAGSFCNSYAIAKWKIFLKGKYFWLRSIGSTLIGDLIELIIVTGVAYVGQFPFHMIIRMTVTVYLLRIVYAVVMAYPAQLIANFLKRSEKTDVFDYRTNFNPFKIK